MNSALLPARSRAPPGAAEPLRVSGSKAGLGPGQTRGHEDRVTRTGPFCCPPRPPRSSASAPAPRPPAPRALQEPAALTGTGEPGISPGRALHHSRPENGRPSRQLRQRLRVAGDGSGAEVHPGRGRQPVDAGQPAQQVAGTAHGPPQDVAYSVRCPQRELRVESAQGRRLEAGGVLQGVGEQGGLHLGHVVQRG